MRASVASIALIVFLRAGFTNTLIFSWEMSHDSRTRVPPSTGSSS